MKYPTIHPPKSKIGDIIIIKDLGMILPNKTSKKPSHCVLINCPICGTEFKANKRNVRMGITKSCGCYKRMRTSQTTKTHGMSYGNRIYKTWIGIKARCYNIHNKRYKDYGGIGVTVCSEWINSFETFHDWALSNGYSDTLSINRIKGSNIYSPETCNWTDKYEQGQTTRLLRSDNTSGYRGVRPTGKKWMTTINAFGEKYYLGVFETKELAALAYNDFVIRHETFHPLNIILNGNREIALEEKF